MRRATITIGDELDSTLHSYIREHDQTLSLSAVVRDALREYLARRGFVPGRRKLRITPAPKGSGARDVSLDHDRYLAGR